MWTKPYCTVSGCEGGEACKQLRINGTCSFEYNPENYKPQHRWPGEGPPPARWVADDGTVVYRCFSDYLDD